MILQHVTKHERYQTRRYTCVLSADAFCEYKDKLNAKQDKGEATKRKAAYCEAAEKWDSDSDSDKSEDEEDLKM